MHMFMLCFYIKAMSLPREDPFRFVIKMALRNALKLVRGLRKQISDAEEDVMAAKLIEEIKLSNYMITKKAEPCGHTFELSEPPAIPDK